MIHSLAGGVIKDGGMHTFVKVENGAGAIWLLCDDFSVEVGDTVVYEGKDGWLKRGIAVKVDKNVSGQTPPVPINRIGIALKVEPNAVKN